MYLLRTESIRAGMRLGRTVSVTGQVLLSAGVELRPSYIEPLLRHGIGAIYVMDDLAPDVTPQDVIDPDTRESMKRDLLAICGALTPLFADATRRGARQFSVQLDTERLVKSVEKAVHDVLRHSDAVINLQDIRSTDEYTLSHSVNVCVLSVLVGAAQGYRPDELRDLAIGAVLHDIGKVITPKEILHKPDRLTPAEFALMKQHSEIGWSILFQQRGIPPTSAAVARQHHERWAGGGYPDGVAGEKIFRYARICTLADCFDAMTADRVYRRGIPAARALEVMQNEMHGWFQPELLFSFLQCVAPYPVGSMVRVTGGLQAVVLDVRRGRNNRPKIRLVRGADGAPLAEPLEVDLHCRTDLEILGTIEAEDEEDCASA